MLHKMAMSARARRSPSSREMLSIVRDISPDNTARVLLVHCLFGDTQRLGDLDPTPSLIDGRPHRCRLESTGQVASQLKSTGAEQLLTTSG